MSTFDPSVTTLLEACRAGDRGAFDRLVSVLYGDLRRLAHHELGRRPPWETLDTTGLVHEAYVKMVRLQGPEWADRAHFLAAAAQAMRHILVDAARRRLTAKHGRGQRPATLDERIVAAEVHAEQVLAIDQVLDQLRALDERMCRVVECQFFAGLTKEETALALDVSVRTVHRDWLRAKAWLKRKLDEADPAEPPE